MSRRPTECRGALVFQEGKRIEKEYYVIAVYDDPGKCTVTFAAYELETDKTFTLPYTYSEMDELFRFNAELMNPNNKESRYHWIIERLDFMMEDAFRKKLCLAAEATVEVVNEPLGKKEPVKNSTKAFHSGKIDATTRAKLIQELGTMDNTHLQNSLVNSENARKEFLQSLHARRRLEQQKALQRISLLDNEKGGRLDQISQEEKIKRDKQLKFQKEEAQKSQTINQLEILMKQKEQDAVRNVLSNMDTENKDRDARFQASIAQKKQIERSWKERRQAERELNSQLEKKRQECFKYKELKAIKRNQEILEKRQRDIDAKMRLRQRKTESANNALEGEIEAKYHQEKLKEKEQRGREMSDLSRTQREMASKGKRNKNEIAHLQELRIKDMEIQKEESKKKEIANKEEQRVARVNLKTKNTLKEQEAEQEELREENIRYRDECRERRLQDEKWLQEREQSSQVQQEVEDPEALRLLFEAEERKKRMDDRERKNQEVEEKTQEIVLSNAKLRDKIEAYKINGIKEKEYAYKAAMEERRLEKERLEQKKEEEALGVIIKRQQTFKKGEQIRDHNLVSQSQKRLDGCLEQINEIPIGTGIPMLFVF